MNKVIATLVAGCMAVGLTACATGARNTTTGGTGTSQMHRTGAPGLLNNAGYYRHDGYYDGRYGMRGYGTDGLGTYNRGDGLHRMNMYRNGIDGINPDHRPHLFRRLENRYNYRHDVGPMNRDDTARNLTGPGTTVGTGAAGATTGAPGTTGTAGGS